MASEANSEQKWKQLAELATSKSQFELAQECLHKANDFGGLLLLATSSGKRIGLFINDFSLTLSAPYNRTFKIVKIFVIELFLHVN